MTNELPEIMFNAAVRSNVGLVRQNNQDSGYVGPNFLLIADGMGGHAGGDVASAITVSRLAALDTPQHSPDLLGELRSAILEANERINAAVAERPELAGMGTTVTALMRQDSRLCLAHIGDSRAYLLRNGELTQMTSDHTFVQMLVDEGRITEDEAEHHPQRSVVMKVLGDVGSTPELDMSIRNAQLGDRWLLCSDGLTGFADIRDIKQILETVDNPDDACDQLVDLALDGGGADNVTVIVSDIVEADPARAEDPGSNAGSVRINPHYALLGSSAESTRQMNVVNDDPAADTDIMHAGDIAAMGKDTGTDDTEEVTQPTSADTEPATQPTSTSGEDDEAEPAAVAAAPAAPVAAASAASAADEEPKPSRAERKAQRKADKKASKRAAAARDDEDDDDYEEVPRRSYFGWIVTVLVVALLAGAALFGWRYIQNQYYVTEENGRVVVYQGVSQDLGPISLSHLQEQTDIEVSSLSSFTQDRLGQTIPAGSKEDVDNIVDNLRKEASRDSSGDGIQGGVNDGTDPAPSSDSESPGGDGQ